MEIEMKWIREKLKRHFDLYDIDDLQVGGHCGCCGKWISDQVLLKNWSVGICRACSERGK